MRETFSSLVLQTQNLLLNDQTNSYTNLSDPKTLIKKQLNLAIRKTTSLMREHATLRTEFSDSTTVDVQYYKKPVNLLSIESITVNVGGTDYQLERVETDKWISLNRIDFAGTTFPQYYYERANDYGIWPIPGESGNAISMIHTFRDKDLSEDDVDVTGTITFTNDDATVTDSGAGFTDAMVGRYLLGADGFWYQIASKTDASNVELVTKYQGVTASSQDTTIAESPEHPPEMHEYLPFFAAAMITAGPNKDIAAGQNYLNYYYTGDFSNTSRKPSSNLAGGVLHYIHRFKAMGTANSRLVNKRKVFRSVFVDEVWNGQQITL